MEIKEIYFVTTNKNKVEILAERLRSCGILLIHKPIFLNESRELSTIEVCKKKMDEAKKILKKPFIVEDRGFFVPALNGFPGTFVKLIHQTIGIKGLLKLMENETDRTAYFEYCLGFFDGKNNHYFVDREYGRLSFQPRGENDRGWGDLMRIFIHDLFPNKTLAELNDEEWKKYKTHISKNDYIQKFLSWLDGCSNARNSG